MSCKVCKWFLRNCSGFAEVLAGQGELELHMDRGWFFLVRRPRPRHCALVRANKLQRSLTAMVPSFPLLYATAKTS